MDKVLKDRVYGRGVNFLAHSMGGLDCRHLITHVKPQDYTPLSLTTIGTPHRGSPFMDWCTVRSISLSPISLIAKSPPKAIPRSRQEPTTSLSHRVFPTIRHTRPHCQTSISRTFLRLTPIIIYHPHALLPRLPCLRKPHHLLPQ